MRFKWLLSVVALVSFSAACGDDSGGTLPLGSSTTTAATTTAATTTLATTTTTTAAPTTTATTAPTPTLGPPPLPPVEFNPDGLGFAQFGDDPVAVMAVAATYFGAPSTDSGWMPGGFGPAGVCPGTQFRQVYYHGDTLMLMFSDADYFLPGGVQNFLFYSYAGPAPITAGPPTSIDVGTTVAQLTAMWPGVTISGDDPLFGNSFYYNPGPGFENLFGQLTGTTPTDTITYLSGGVGCGE